VRSFVLGLFLITAVAVTVLSLRPGGLGRQLRFVARRLRIVLVLGGIYIFVSMGLRLAFPQGPLADYAPPVLAIVLAIVFVVAARDPAPTTGSPRP
jgi:hypothetical protein